jgi:hypothetical protein
MPGSCSATSFSFYEKKYANDPRVAFVVVSLDDDPRRLNRYLADAKFPFTVLYSSFSAAGKQYQVSDTPTTFYIDAKGMIRYMAKGIEAHGDADARISWFIEELKKN